jgi:hypothetical protein
MILATESPKTRAPKENMVAFKRIKPVYSERSNLAGRLQYQLSILVHIAPRPQ